MLKKVLTIGLFMTGVLLNLSCSEINREDAPVELVGTLDQDIQSVDLSDPGCGLIGTVTLTSIVKRADSARTDLLAVKLTRMRVAYVRTDGGSVVPQSFTQTISGLVTPGGTAPLNNFVVFENDAFSRAPFVALIPSNGGIDPETSRRLVKLDVVMDVFGETLAGDDVSTRVRFPLTFCVACGGCQ